jgi:hypothetical protein
MFVDDSTGLLFITTYMQFQNFAKFTTQMPDQFAPNTCKTPQITNTELTTPGAGCEKLLSCSNVNEESSMFEYSEKRSWDIPSKNRKVTGKTG